MRLVFHGAKFRVGSNQSYFCVENYLQRTKERTNNDSQENNETNKEKMTCDFKVTGENNGGENSVDGISSVTRETNIVEGRGQCERENLSNSVKKKSKNERISKKESQKTNKMEHKKKEGMVIK